MKNVLLGTLIAFASTQAAGCIISTNTNNNNARITASWILKSEATNSNVGCPPGFDTAALYNQQIDVNNAPIGQPIIDLFDCVNGTGTSAPLPPAVYQTWVDITNHTNTSQYAQSLSAIVDVTVADKTFSAQILVDGGYFQLAWNLVGATSGQPLTCAQAGATGGVEAVTTDVANASNAHSDIFHCPDRSGVTAGLRAATYTISVDALNASMQAIGVAPSFTSTIRSPNKVTDLGTVNVPITGK